MQRAKQKGQVVILVLLALGLFLIGGMGLAIDGAHLYAQRQAAQAAADSAAQAAALSIMGTTNVATFYNNEFGAADFVCANGTDARTPCVYAQANGFGRAGSTDVVEVGFPDASAAPGVELSPLYTPTLVSVTIRRTVDTTLMRFLGSTGANVRVSAMAGLVQDDSPIPIIVLHPRNCESYRRGGTALLKICGGPKQSVQVNSAAPACNALDDDGGLLPASGVDLSMAGPNGNQYCTSTGPTGGIFGTFGGPNSYPGPIDYGTEGTFWRRRPISDPFADVPVPEQPANAPDPEPRAAGVDGCPNPPPWPCFLYSPGYYPDGIAPGNPTFEVKNRVALFKPGLYYMGSNGFRGGPNSLMLMAKDAANVLDPAHPEIGYGMLVYSTGPLTGGMANAGKFEVGANGSAFLTGSDPNSVWEGLLFYQDRNSVAHTGVNNSHRLGGGGDLSLFGSVYFTNTPPPRVTATRYQELSLRGNSGSNTEIIGNIVVDVLDVGGGGTIRMALDPNKKQIITKVALVK
jgi:Flp pilus assembly protein TadG